MQSSSNRSEGSPAATDLGPQVPPAIPKPLVPRFAVSSNNMGQVEETDDVDYEMEESGSGDDVLFISSSEPPAGPTASSFSATSRQEAVLGFGAAAPKSTNSWIAMFVGPSKLPIFAEKSRLVQSSLYFKACLSENYTEGQAEAVSLPEDKPTTVLWYLAWLYCGRFPQTKATREDVSIFMPTSLYRFADRIQCCGLKHQLLADAHHNIKSYLSGAKPSPAFSDLLCYIDPKVVSDVIANLTDGDGLRRMIILFIAVLLGKKALGRAKMDQKKYPDDVALELGKVLLQGADLLKPKQVFPDLAYFERKQD